MGRLEGEMVRRWDGEVLRAVPSLAVDFPSLESEPRQAWEVSRMIFQAWRGVPKLGSLLQGEPGINSKLGGRDSKVGTAPSLTWI